MKCYSTDTTYICPLRDREGLLWCIHDKLWKKYINMYISNQISPVWRHNMHTLHNFGINIFMNSLQIIDKIIHAWLPNQPHLLNKYQVHMVFSHFHEFVIWSRISIMAPYQIDIVKGCGFCNGSIILILYWFYLPTIYNQDFGRWKQHLFDILFFTRLCIR